MEEISINQTIDKKGAGCYDVEIVVNDGEKKVFYYDDTNAIYPLYNSLTQTIMNMKDVHVKLNTNSRVFASEILGSPNRNTRMLEILNNYKERRNITISTTNDN